MPLYTLSSPLTYGPALLLAALFIVQIFYRRRLYITAKIAVPVAIIGMAVFLAYLSSQRLIAWQQSELTQILVPPLAPPDYFIQYVGFRLLAPYVMGLLLSILFYIIANYINKKSTGLFFEKDEPLLAMLGIFLVSWPGALVYVFGVLVVSVVGSLLQKFFARGKRDAVVAGLEDGGAQARFPMFYLWIPMAIFVILIRGWLLELAGMWALTFSLTF